MGSRTDVTARAVIECAADAIVAFSTDRTVMLWNPAAERMFGWAAAEILGLEPQIIPEELKAEHNAVLERVRGGGQISFATRRIRKDGTIIEIEVTSSDVDVDGRECRIAHLHDVTERNRAAAEVARIEPSPTARRVTRPRRTRPRGSARRT